MSYNRKQKHRFKFTQLSKSNRQEKGFKDLESEIRNRLGMNQASSMWQTMKYMKTKPNNKVLPMRKQFYEEV